MNDDNNKITKIRPPCPKCTLFAQRVVFDKDGSFEGIMDCPIYKEDYSCFNIVN